MIEEQTISIRQKLDEIKSEIRQNRYALNAIGLLLVWCAVSLTVLAAASCTH